MSFLAKLQLGLDLVIKINSSFVSYTEGQTMTVTVTQPVNCAWILVSQIENPDRDVIIDGVTYPTKVNGVTQWFYVSGDGWYYTANSITPRSSGTVSASILLTSTHQMTVSSFRYRYRYRVNAPLTEFGAWIGWYVMNESTYQTASTPDSRVYEFELEAISVVGNDYIAVGIDGIESGRADAAHPFVTCQHISPGLTFLDVGIGVPVVTSPRHLLILDNKLVIDSNGYVAGSVI